MYMCTVTCCPTGIQDKKSLPTSSQIKHNSIATCCPTGIQEKLPHHHRSSSAAQNPQRCVLVACTRSQTIVMFLKALQDSRKKVPTLSLALYPSERAIMIGRLLIEPSFTDDERVAAPSNEGHSCGTVCLACSLHLNLLSPSTPPGIRYKHVTALSWHRPEQVVQLFTPPSCTPRTRPRLSPWRYRSNGTPPKPVAV